MELERMIGKKMEKLDRLTTLLKLLAAAASFLFLVFLVCMEDAPLTRLLLGACYLTGIAACVLLLLQERRNLYRFSDSVEQTLDEMIKGAENVSFDDSRESICSKLQAKLEKLYGIQRSYAKLTREEKLKLQALISDISHQTKTPMATIRMYCDILRERSLPPEKTGEFLGEIDKQAEKLEFLISSMIKTSRLETGVLKIEKKSRLLFDTLRRAVGSVLPKADKKGISVAVSCSEELMVSHDSKWTEEAIFNLLDNAVKYTQEGGCIELTAQRQEYYTRISVSDTGKGIEESRRAEIFQRFYREPEVRETEGVGIGLYLTRQIVTLQGGYVEVAARPGGGSDFRIYLPEENDGRPVGQ